MSCAPSRFFLPSSLDRGYSRILTLSSPSITIISKSLASGGGAERAGEILGKSESDTSSHFATDGSTAEEFLAYGRGFSDGILTNCVGFAIAFDSGERCGISGRSYICEVSAGNIAIYLVI